MASTADPWRCQVDFTGRVPSDVQEDQKLHTTKATVPILQRGCKQTYGQVKAYPVPASLQLEMRSSIQGSSSYLFTYCARSVCLSEHSWVCCSQSYGSGGICDARPWVGAAVFRSELHHTWCAAASWQSPSTAKKHISFLEGEGFTCAVLLM